MNALRTYAFTLLLILAFVLAGSPLLIAFADTRDAGSRESDRASSRETPAQPVPAPTPDPTPTPPAGGSGGINNTTSGEVQTGNNEGGQVTTGDESVDVAVINVGPVNNSSQVETSTPPPPQMPQCSTDRRAPNPCSSDAADRAR
ncbi:MAG: hypothetical protein RLZZ416_62 [Candidatus Parcubacteria bacterium]|jgi:hypothetical protein